jgi:H+/Cl- antiporter ClcA
MEFLQNEYSYAGFFSAATISAMHFQDFLIAMLLGFAGGLGGWIFKCLKEIIQKKRASK